MQNVLPLRRNRESAPELIAEPVPTVEPVDGNGANVVSDHPTVPVASIARVDAVHLGSLAWLAIRCALVATIVGAMGATLLWMFATATGVVARSESFMESIGFRDFEVSATRVIAGTVLVVGGVALALATAAVVAGAAYNLFAFHGKGLRVRLAMIAETPEGPLAPAPGTLAGAGERGSPAA